MIKGTKTKVIVAGRWIESYRYERPLLYNTRPAGKSLGRHTRISVDEIERRRIDSLRRTQHTLRRIINANATPESKSIFLTYTFAINQKNLRVANRAFTLHIQKFKRLVPNLRYIAVIEFQKRGAVHYHVVFFGLPYIPQIKSVIADIWPHGFIHIRAINNVKALGAYVAKYLSKDTFDERLVGEKAYLRSRNLVAPVMSYEENALDKALGDAILQDTRVERSYHSSKYGKIHYKLIEKKIYADLSSQSPIAQI